MKKLTSDTYFTLNKALTNSKTKDFLNDKNYFYKKHIEGSITQNKTSALIVGSGVDDVLTAIDGASTNKFICVTRRNLKNPPTDHIELNQTMYDEIINIADAVMNTDAYKQLIKEDYIRQEILQIPWDGGNNFDSLAGTPDFYKIHDNGLCTIVDLKTTTELNPRKYHFTCETYSYYQQMAFYSFLLSEINKKKIKAFRYLHLAVAKTKDIYPVEVFELPEERIDEERTFLLNDVLPMIAQETEFAKYNPSLDAPVCIGQDF